MLLCWLQQPAIERLKLNPTEHFHQSNDHCFIFLAFVSIPSCSQVASSLSIMLNLLLTLCQYDCVIGVSDVCNILSIDICIPVHPPVLLLSSILCKCWTDTAKIETCPYSGMRIYIYIYANVCAYEGARVWGCACVCWGVCMCVRVWACACVRLRVRSRPCAHKVGHVSVYACACGSACGCWFANVRACVRVYMHIWYCVLGSCTGRASARGPGQPAAHGPGRARILWYCAGRAGCGPETCRPGPGPGW